MVTTGEDMEINLVGEALKFMVLGMGIVFLFLTVLIFVLKGQAAILTKYFPEKEKANANAWQPESNQQDDKSKIIAAITAAVQHHKNLKG